jgi:glycosyltransferase involved in cell wall biosynthesis
MRIVEVIGSLQIGGAENQVVQLLNGLNSTMLEKHLVYFQPVENHLSRALNEDVRLHHIQLIRHGQIGCIARLADLFLRIRPSVVQSHMFHINHYVTIAARIARVPVVLTTEHGKNLWKNAAHHFIERCCISPLATLRVCVSEDIRTIRMQTRDIPANKIVVIPPCVEIPDRGVEYRDRSPLKIGAVGRMVDAKDYPTLLRAIARVFDAGVQAELIFLGDGPERNHLERLCLELGITGVVRFLGFQSNVADWLRDFDIVVFSSVREGIPVAMLEAMAAGVPVVATCVGGIPEVIRDGVDGLLVESGHPVYLADAIVRTACDLELRRILGVQGRKRVRTLYSRESICTRYEKLFQKLLARRKVNVW